jgi:ATP-dependent exoDNAse (exonuclease V) beta subunit
MNRAVAMPTLPHSIIRASAGTGKTFQLSNRFLALLLQGAPPERILASTFTRKAAGEIRSRILLRLARAASDRAALAELDEQLHCGGELSRERCLELLVQLVRNLHQLRVGTLDSFFAQIARSLCLELGLSPHWTIVDDLDDARLRDEAIEAVLTGSRRDDLLRIYHLMTKGEAQRGVAELARTTVNDVYSLFQETRREAWHALQRRTELRDDELADLVDELRTLTLPDKRMDSARAKDAEKAAAGDWDGLLDNGLAARVLDGSCTYWRKPIPPQAVVLYQQLIEHVRAVVVGRTANQTEGTYELLARFDVEYQRLKHERRAMRFEDVTRRLAQAAHPGALGRLAFRLDAGIDHLLLDEFQDTAPPQWQVLRPIAQQVTEPGARRTFFCVGDVKQAIYGWRGGVAEIFDAVELELEGLEASPLNTSFRSSPAVIDVVNRVFRNVTRHDNLDRMTAAVHRWSEQFEEHETAKRERAGYVRLETPPEPLSPFEFAAQRVSEIVAAAPGHSVGVLVRRNDAVAQLIYHLRKLGVHASEEGGNPLTDSAAVLQVLAALKLGDHPGDTVARYQVAHSPLGPELGLADFDSRRQAADAAHAVRRRLADLGYGGAVYQWAKTLAPHCNRRELSRLQQLVALAYGYEPRATLRTDDFLALVERQKVDDPTTADVRVMTVHQAKGLEFDVVVLPELDMNLVGQPPSFVESRPEATAPPERVCRYVNSKQRPLLPAAFQQVFDETTDRETSEALCVLYVALTRAIHALHMIVKPRPARGVVPKTSAGLLLASLCASGPAPPGTLLHEHGDPRWYEHPQGRPRRPIEPRAAQLPRVEPLRVRLAAGDERRTRGLGRASPSGLEGGTRVRLGDLLRSEGSGGMHRGTLVHKWFEQITWLEDGVPDDAALLTIAAEAVENDVDVRATLADFRQMLLHDEIARQLTRASYSNAERLGFSPAVCRDLQAGACELRVYNERRFAVREENRILNGSIDRLVVLRRGGKTIAAEILDFKTDAVGPEPGALDRKVAFYRPQVEAYRSATARMLGLAPDRIAARLLFVGLGQTRAIDAQ